MQVDQAQLQTVIPKTGGSVSILQGEDLGHRATLVAIDIENYRAQVQFATGQRTWKEYEHICKV